MAQFVGPGRQALPQPPYPSDEAAQLGAGLTYLTRAAERRAAQILAAMNRLGGGIQTRIDQATIDRLTQQGSPFPPADVPRPVFSSPNQGVPADQVPPGQDVPEQPEVLPMWTADP